MTRANNRNMAPKEICSSAPDRKRTSKGSETGRKREVSTTMPSTRVVCAPTRPEMKGATTPVETPLSSRTGRAYSGHSQANRKKRLIGKARSLMIPRVNK